MALAAVVAAIVAVLIAPAVAISGAIAATVMASVGEADASSGRLSSRGALPTTAWPSYGNSRCQRAALVMPRTRPLSSCRSKRPSK
jgi:hypothetical protein